MTAEHGPLSVSLEEYLEERGILDDVEDRATKAIFARQLKTEIKRERMSKRQVAKEIGTSRSQLDRILDQNYDDVTIGALKRAAEVVGLSVKLELIPTKWRSSAD